MDAAGWWDMVKGEQMSPLVGHVLTSLVLYAEQLEVSQPEKDEEE
jgi:hypothetical protein